MAMQVSGVRIKGDSLEAQNMGDLQAVAAKAVESGRGIALGLPNRQGPSQASEGNAGAVAHYLGNIFDRDPINQRSAVAESADGDSGITLGKPNSDGSPDTNTAQGITAENDAPDQPSAVVDQQQAPKAPPAAAAPSPDATRASDGTSIPQDTDVRPSGDKRTADQIVDSSATLKNLQSSDKDDLKKRVGDWTDPKLTPDQRADAAYRASNVLSFIKTSNAADGSKRSDNVTQDGKLDGETSKKEARHGTEYGMFKDYLKYGTSSLQASNHNLPKTDDKFVNKDGTTQSNIQHSDKKALNGLKKVANVFLEAYKGIQHVASKIAGIVASLKIPGISQVAGLVSTVSEGLSQAANVGQTALNGGNVKQAAEQGAIKFAENAADNVTGLKGTGKLIGDGIESGVKAGKSAAKGAGEQAA